MYMPPQRVRLLRKDGTQYIKWPAEGAVGCQPVKLRRADIRQLSGICWYPAEGIRFLSRQNG